MALVEYLSPRESDQHGGCCPVGGMEASVGVGSGAGRGEDGDDCALLPAASFASSVKPQKSSPVA
eukprot:CAMPEP_0177781124 /NCGR_PEP_ID=MMETSP0491_2-20121128/17653_1 /TAXON_ID=63592 /ORGANISM="Tetraselmis chuii, Strain PLY429" /LENGTH=64 /DNA_ID=CAMNT_0019301109 /DNA_START=13 /DNA_END=204 /DNA_ORIENTATION=+